MAVPVQPAGRRRSRRGAVRPAAAPVPGPPWLMAAPRDEIRAKGAQSQDRSDFLTARPRFRGVKASDLLASSSSPAGLQPGVRRGERAVWAAGRRCRGLPSRLRHRRPRLPSHSSIHSHARPQAPRPQAPRLAAAAETLITRHPRKQPAPMPTKPHRPPKPPPRINKGHVLVGFNLSSH